MIRGLFHVITGDIWYPTFSESQPRDRENYERHDYQHIEETLLIGRAIRIRRAVRAEISVKFARLREEIASRPVDPITIRDPYATIEWETP